mgnify:CR=1 FL=1
MTMDRNTQEESQDLDLGACFDILQSTCDTLREIGVGAGAVAVELALGILAIELGHADA